MSQQLLHRADVVAVLQEVRREGVPKRVAPCRLQDAGDRNGVLHGTLKRGLVVVMPANLARLGVSIDARGREDPLPCELTPRVWILSAKRVWELHPAGSPPNILLVKPAHPQQVTGQPIFDGARQHHSAIPIALPGPHDDLVLAEIHILDPEAKTLEQANARSVQTARP
jgi:hypothetical protein